MRNVILVTFLALAACAPIDSGPAPRTAPAAPADAPEVARLNASQAAALFRSVKARLEPVAEAECRARAPQRNCDYSIVYDANMNQQSNAYQTLDKSGRPVLTITAPLAAEVYSADELAFVMSHEAAHHISGHLTKSRDTAMIGGVLGGLIAVASGAGQAGVEAAQNIGATVGARTYSKGYELEADQLGTIIAYRAGYNPERGAEFFTRIPDPGDRFLGTHPPNAQRIETVRRTLSTLR